MAQEVEKLTDAHEGLFVRIIRTHKDAADRLKPEIYLVTHYWVHRQTLMLKNALTDELVDVPKKGEGKLLVFTPNEAFKYLMECSQRANENLEFVQAQLSELLDTQHKCNMASMKVLQENKAA